MRGEREDNWLVKVEEGALPFTVKSLLLYPKVSNQRAVCKRASTSTCFWFNAKERNIMVL